LRETASGAIISNLVMRRDGEFLLLLEPATGACVALTETEAAALQRTPVESC
jgi:hypothetical protein